VYVCVRVCVCVCLCVPTEQGKRREFQAGLDGHGLRRREDRPRLEDNRHDYQRRWSVDLGTFCTRHGTLTSVSRPKTIVTIVDDDGLLFHQARLRADSVPRFVTRDPRLSRGSMLK